MAINAKTKKTTARAKVTRTIAQSGRTSVTKKGNVVHVKAESIRGAAPVDRTVTLDRSGDLNEKETRLLSFVARHKAENDGTPPNRREIQEDLFQAGLSSQRGSHYVGEKFIVGACSVTNKIIESLESKGYASRTLASGSRSLALAKDEKSEIEAAKKFLRSLGYNITKKKPVKKAVK